MSLLLVCNPPKSSKKSSKKANRNNMAKKRRKKAGRKAGRRKNPRRRKVARRSKRRATRRRKNPRGRNRKTTHIHRKAGRRLSKRQKARLVKRGWASIGANRRTYINPTPDPFYAALRLGARNPGHSPMLRGPFSYTATLRGKKASRTVKRHMAKAGWGRIVKRGRRAGQLRLNPVNGMNVVSIAKQAAGLGTGAILATKVVPAIVGRFVPAAGSGLVGAAVGLLGAGVLGRVIAKVTKVQGLAGQVQTGALAAAIGVPLVGMISQYLPAAVTRPLGLSGMRGFSGITPVSAMIRDEALYAPTMRDYLQLSGPVPETVFSNGLNDYVNFQNQGAGLVAEAASAAVTEWTPAGEGF